MMIILISAWILRVESCRIPSLVRSIHHFSPDILPILCQSNQQKHMPIPFFCKFVLENSNPPKPGPWKADKKQLKQATAESHRIQKMFASVDQAQPLPWMDAELMIFGF